MALNTFSTQTPSKMNQPAGLATLRHNGAWLTFNNPQAIYSTHNLADVVPLLTEVESRAKQENRYALGMISYEASAAFDPAQVTHPADDFPLVWFALYDRPSAEWEPESNDLAQPFTDWHPNIPPVLYFKKIGQIHDHIARGETYQVNFSYRQRATYSGAPESLFAALNRGKNGQYGALLNTGRFAVCSASPELFFTFNPSTRALRSKPMKGTINRGKTAAEDLANSHWLQQSEKNRAENLMIVDMIRNDMSRVATLGTVQVPKLFELEKYATLWTMTSTVEADVRPEKNLTDVLSALFPCASITGAPKVSTMRIIRELESTPRGIYCGSIGLIEPNGNATFNVAIRTAVVDHETNQAIYGVGGGIVWDSEAESEWIETQTKSKILFPSNPKLVQS